MNVSKDQLQVYAVTDSQWLHNNTLAQAVEEAILGGATFIQLREKNMTTSERVAAAAKIKAVTNHYHIPFVVNDDVQAALASGADGVHIGQEDMQAAEARRLLGPDKILGVSAQTVEQALLAQAHGADYLGVGAVFSTSTKADAVEVPFATLQAICQAVQIPVIAIGGVKADNIHLLQNSGIAGVAVVSAIFAADDIPSATKRLAQAVQRMLAT